ncbi:MAG: hypothetical protein ABJA78_13515 [Ferruginibacter sp.]
MQTALLVLHSLLRWGVLLFGLWAVFSALGGTFSKRLYSANDNRSGMLFMIFCDIQLLVGIVLYFKNDWFSLLKDHFKETMHNDNRFFAMEHMAMMILGWLLVHVGRIMVKKGTTDKSKHTRGLIFFGLALIIILAAIPWPLRATNARPWFHWFN